MSPYILCILFSAWTYISWARNYFSSKNFIIFIDLGISGFPSLNKALKNDYKSLQALVERRCLCFNEAEKGIGDFQRYLAKSYIRSAFKKHHCFFS